MKQDRRVDHLLQRGGSVDVVVVAMGEHDRPHGPPVDGADNCEVVVCSVEHHDLTIIACWAEEVYEINPSKDLMVECLSAVAAENSFHPVLDWETTLTWDGVERLPSMLTTDRKSVV